MRNALLAALMIGAGALGSHAADAMTMGPVAPGGPGSVVLVDGGCGGPEFFRAPDGVCYRKRQEYRRDGYGYGRPPEGPPPGAYRREGCPPGTHPTPYGCRPNY